MSIADKLKTAAQKMEDVYRTGLFKYAPKSTASGETILLENSAPEPFVNMKPYGHSWQNGTPTPSAPIEFESAKEVKVLGGNLVRYPYSESTVTKNGIDFIDNGDGGITIKGTATEDTWFNFAHNGHELDLHSGNYVLSAEGIADEMLILLHDKATDSYYPSYVPIWIEEATKCNVFIQVIAGATIYTTIYPMLNEGEYALPYQPYTEQTLTLPSLNGIGDVRDYVEYDRKKLVRRYAEINPSTLVWYAIDTSRYYCDIPNIKERSVTENNGHSLFTHGEYKNAIWSDTSKTGYVINNTNLHVRDASVSTLEELLAKIQDSVLLYELAEPIETDLTDEQIYAFKRLRANSPNTTIIGQGQVDVTYIVDNRQ